MILGRRASDVFVQGAATTVTLHARKCTSNLKLFFQDSGLPNFRWSHVDAEIISPSVFHLYGKLAELKMTKDVPLWLEKIRMSGKTRTEAKYV